MSRSATLSLLLKRAEHVLRDQLQPVLDTEDLQFEHWQILAVLLENPGTRMSDVAEAAVLPPATLTRHMDRLVEHALVIRRIDTNDKRATVVALSARGKTYAEKLSKLERVTASSLEPLHLS